MEQHAVYCLETHGDSTINSRLHKAETFLRK
jgi:hypothetical protein